MKDKTHYRKVFKSDHLGVADLEEIAEEKGGRFIYTIAHVKQEIGVSVAGRKGNYNIAYFTEPIKPLVLNATNSRIVKSFAPDKSPFVEDWNNITVELYIDSKVKMKGEVVGGVRIRPTQPVITKPFLTADHERFDKAKAAWKSGKKDAILARFQVSDEVQKLLEG